MGHPGARAWPWVIWGVATAGKADSGLVSEGGSQCQEVAEAWRGPGQEGHPTVLPSWAVGTGACCVQARSWADP